MVNNWNDREVVELLLHFIQKARIKRHEEWAQYRKQLQLRKNPAFWGYQRNSAIAFRFGDMVVVAADTQLSYGGLVKSAIKRIIRFDDTLIAFSGELSDIQYIEKHIFLEKQRMNEEFLDPKSHFTMLREYLYSMRSQLKPLNVDCIVAGYDFLKVVTLRGGFYESNVVALGMAGHLALPGLRIEENEDVKSKIEEAMKIMFRKSASSSNEIQIGYIRKEGIEMETVTLNVDWEHGRLEMENSI